MLKSFYKTMKNLFEERNHIENLLSTRFNFFLVIFASIIASSFAVKNPNQLLIILLIGAILESFLAMVIFRSERKLDLLLEEIYKDPESAAKIINDRANKGIFNFSMRRIIGYIIPILVSITLIFGACYYKKVYNYLNTGNTSTTNVSIENRLDQIENEFALLKPQTNKPEDLKSIIIGLLAVVISIISLFVVIGNNRKNSRIQKAVFHVDRNLTFEGKLSEWTEAFKFYGVDLENAKENGITPQQITYLILSINTLSSIAMFDGKKVKDLIKGNSYRENMFMHLETRKTWIYAKKFFSNETVKAIDDYLNEKYPENTKPNK